MPRRPRSARLVERARCSDVRASESRGTRRRVVLGARAASRLARDTVAVVGSCDHDPWTRLSPAVHPAAAQRRRRDPWHEPVRITDSSLATGRTDGRAPYGAAPVTADVDLRRDALEQRVGSSSPSGDAPCRPRRRPSATRRPPLHRARGRAQRRRRASLLRDLDRARLADHDHLHLTRVLELILDLSRDLVRQQRGARRRRPRWARRSRGSRAPPGARTPSRRPASTCAISSSAASRLM